MIRAILQETGEISVVGTIVEICLRKAGRVVSVVSVCRLTGEDGVGWSWWNRVGAEGQAQVGDFAVLVKTDTELDVSARKWAVDKFKL